MTLKEQLTEKKSALKELEEQIKAGDEEAIKAGEEIANAINEIEASIESAEKAQEILSLIGNEEEPEENGMEMEEKNRTSAQGAKILRCESKLATFFVGR